MPKTEEEDPVKPIEDQILHGPKTVTMHGTPMGDHTEIDPNTGMQKDYIVLSEHERSKGFVRPVRNSYIHVGPKPIGTLRDLTSEEQERYKGCDYVKYEEYPKPNPDGSSAVGCFWTKAKYERFLNPCGGLTKMSQALSETYARDPKFYSGTFCTHCRDHFDVGPKGEFVWADTDEKVGT